MRALMCCLTFELRGWLIRIRFGELDTFRVVEMFGEERTGGSRKFWRSVRKGIVSMGEIVFMREFRHTGFVVIKVASVTSVSAACISNHSQMKVPQWTKEDSW